ncbi:lipase 3-like [Bombyx mandarina]|uniref:Lipase 3-like n=1 Tax=Bombyx mandarina TaxID=7092 RepID=A0A6J2JZQ8_BOMMA|nr:lipase 3-like [Bombyx mandarina]
MEVVQNMSNTIKGFFVKTMSAIKKKFQNLWQNTKEVIEKKKKSIKKSLINFVTKLLQAETESKNKTVLFSETQHDTENNMQGPQLIAFHGYKVELHTLMTSDGYLLTVHRLSLTGHIQTESKVVILHHGMLGSSDDFILLGKSRSLPYMLSEAGYDVWLANARGNKYSKMHSAKPADAPDFWDFSFHEIGLYDLSALINYVLQIRDKVEICLIGYSMGATSALALLSTDSIYNEILKSVILIAPLVFMRQVKGPLKQFAGLTNNEDELIDILDPYEIAPFKRLSRELVDRFCPGDAELCENPLLFLTNGGQEFSDENIKELVLNHVPAGGSTKTILHYIQLIKSARFQMYDHGPQSNLKNYGTITPPLYNLRNVTTPVYLLRLKYIILDAQIKRYNKSIGQIFPSY